MRACLLIVATLFPALAAAQQWYLVEAEDHKSVTIKRDYDPGLPLIELDRDQMVQAFLNLVRNAAAALDVVLATIPEAPIWDLTTARS